MTNQPLSEEQRRFELSNETRKFEIDLLWRRAAYFWAFIASAFAAFGLAVANDELGLALLSGVFGLVSSLGWTVVNRGSRFWFLVWEKRTKDNEAAVVGDVEFFRDTNPDEISDGWFGGTRFSVSRTAIAFSDFVVVVWLVALGWQLFEPGNEIEWDRVSVALVGSVALNIFFVGFLMWKELRSHPTDKS